MRLAMCPTRVVLWTEFPKLVERIVKGHLLWGYAIILNHGGLDEDCVHVDTGRSSLGTTFLRGIRRTWMHASELVFNVAMCCFCAQHVNAFQIAAKQQSFLSIGHHLGVLPFSHRAVKIIEQGVNMLH